MPVVRGKADAGLTATQFIDAWFESGKKKADAMDKTPAEEVTVSGRKFTCVNYRRVSDGKQFNGFIAATGAKKGIFAVTAQDVAGQNDSLNACWASLKTFNSTTE